MSDPSNGTARGDDRSRASDGGPDIDALAARLSAVERAVTDDETRPAASPPVESPYRCDDPDHSDDPDFDGRLSAVEEALADLDARLDEVEAATQALRGYVGAVRSVNREVERRADAALAAVERLEAEGGEASRGAVREVDSGHSVPTDHEGEAYRVVDTDGNEGEDENVGNERENEGDEAGRGDANDDGEWGVAARLRDAL